MSDFIPPGAKPEAPVTPLTPPPSNDAQVVHKEETVHEKKAEKSKPVREPYTPVAWYRWVLFSAILIPAGLILGLWLQTKYYTTSQAAYKAYIGISEATDALDYVKEAILGANKEVIIAARHINSKPIMDAIVAKFKENVTIVVLLDVNEPKSQTIFNYLTQNGVPASRVRINKALAMQAIIIDETYVIAGNMPYNTTALQSNGDMTVFRNPELAKSYKEKIKEIIRN